MFECYVPSKYRLTKISDIMRYHLAESSFLFFGLYLQSTFTNMDTSSIAVVCVCV